MVCGWGLQGLGEMVNAKDAGTVHTEIGLSDVLLLSASRSCVLWILMLKLSRFHCSV